MENKTKDQLINELRALRSHLAEFNKGPVRENNKEILKRKKAEQSLRITQFSFDQANIGIYRIAPDGRILEVNPKAAQFLGFSKNELESMSIIDIDPQVTRESWPGIWKDLLKNRVHFFETAHRREDGSIMPVEVYGNLLEFEDQQFSIAFVQDITERKQMEQDLKESRERLDLALEGANQGIWDWHMDQGIIHFDARYYTMAGYDPGEFPANFQEWEKRLHKDDITQARSIIDQYIIGNLDTFEIEFRFQRKEGTYMWIQGKGKIVARDDRGNPTRFIGTHSDITDRKQAEKALRENERLLSNILESMNEGVMVLDSDFKYQIVNKKLEEYGSTPREQMVGKRPWDVFESIRGTVIEDNIRKTMAGQQAGTIPIQLPMPHATRWFRDSFSPIKNDRGRVLGVVGVVSDISRQKQDEEEMRRLRNYLSNIINSMPSILVAVDAKGRVTQWNSQAEKITGISLEQAQEHPLEEVFPRLSENMAQIREAVEAQKVITLPKVARRMAQETCFEDITIFPLAANVTEGAVIRVDDITEQVRLEEIMIQNEKMVTIGGLAAGMAHEINNPLASMLQTARVMQNRLGTLMDIPANRIAARKAGVTMEGIEQFMAYRGIHRMLETIVSSGKRAAEIVHNMLSFVRKNDEVKTFHQLNEIVESTLALAATDYNQKKKYDFKKIKITKAYAQHLPPALCNSAKIQQVLLNIMGNAAQAMQEAGTKAPLLILRTFTDKAQTQICLAIEDNGPGMDRATCKKVFDPFFTTKPVGQGTGLGLSVSYFIITENHGGEMTVESTPGKGTTFIIKLPVQRQAEN